MIEGNILEVPIKEDGSVAENCEAPVQPINKTYCYHKPSADGLAKISVLRRAFSTLHDEVERQAPKSRELSVALTNLEQSAMWAIKAVVCNDPQSVIAE